MCRLGIIALLCGCFLGAPAWSAEVVDQAVRLTAVVEKTPPRILLLWPAAAGATSFEVFRRTADATHWGSTLATLPGEATHYVDDDVAVGMPYEYRVRKVDSQYGGEGYLCAGFEVPAAEARGCVLLVVEASVAVALSAELRRLTLDLVGDGWTVRRRDVARGASVTEVRALIQSEYAAEPSRVRSLFLLGHVPVPYSGDAYPDNHPDHRGAWPADVYYADVDGLWTDATVNRGTATDPRNRNVPADGKFDQTRLPSDVELEVGRVDFANLPAFGASELELLRRYLDKDHAFRQGRMPVRRRGLIDDEFGLGVGEAYAVSGWRSFVAFFGTEGTVAADWMTSLAGGDYLWGYGCGGGTYTSVGGVVTTVQLAAADPRVVFTMLYGSYFGDWDSTNNVMRSALATPGYTLTSAWAGRPHWQFHHMGLGETIGHSARLVQNNDGTRYQIPGFGRFIHIALMGDPTLRLHPSAPPTGLTVSTVERSSVNLAWSAAPGLVEGYVVCRASSGSGPFTRLHAGWVTNTVFWDGAPVFPAVYRVQAVRLETSPSGTYFNPSQGAFEDTDGNYGSPALRASQGQEPGVVRLEWPAVALGFRLESSPTLTPTAWNEWHEASPPAETADDRLRVEVQADSSTRWFRLAKP